MAKKFNVEEAREARRVRLSQIDEEIKSVEKTRESFWTGHGFSNYDEYCKYDKQMRRLEKEKRNLVIMLQDKFYISQHLWSDVHAYEVLYEKSAKCIVIRRMSVTEEPEAQKKRMESFIPCGFVGHFDNSLQEWIYESDESQPEIEVRLHSDGNYYEANHRTCPYILTKEPYERYDFNF